MFSLEKVTADALATAESLNRLVDAEAALRLKGRRGALEGSGSR